MKKFVDEEDIGYFEALHSAIKTRKFLVKAVFAKVKKLEIWYSREKYTHKVMQYILKDIIQQTARILCKIHTRRNFSYKNICYFSCKNFECNKIAPWSVKKDTIDFTFYCVFVSANTQYTRCTKVERSQRPKLHSKQTALHSEGPSLKVLGSWKAVLFKIPCG